MKWDNNSLRNFILSIVKPFKTGLVVSQDELNTKLDNLYPEGTADNFRNLSPFGFISRVPKAIPAFWNSLFGSGYENIILGYLHKNRPTPVGVGEVILYSTTEDGTTVKATLVLKNDGSIEITSPTTLKINCVGNSEITTQAKALITASSNVEINSQAEVKITAATKIEMNSDDIEVGVGTVEKILNGETFQQFFNNHQHMGNIGYPTSTPLVPSSSIHLSQTVKAKK